MIIRELLVRFLRPLILSVVMRREVLQVHLQVGQHLRRLFGFEVLPVFGLQSVPGYELPLRFQHELGESGFGESFHHVHAETRRSTVERIERCESLGRLRRVVVAQLRQVVLAKIAVNAVLVGSIPEGGEVLLDGLLRAAEVAEAQADDSKSIGDAAFVLLLVRLIEFVAGRHLIVEQLHVPMQGVLVELLLVERPPELVESELVVGGIGAQVDDR